jgi:hypothetical protein
LGILLKSIAKAGTPNMLQRHGELITHRTTKGTIKKVHVPRGKKAPWFEIFFPDCKITYNKLDMEYVLHYSRELPQKYNEIKAKYIIELSRVAALEAAEQEEMTTKPAAETKEASVSKRASTDTPETPAPKKKGGSYFCVSFSCHGFIIEIVIKYSPSPPPPIFLNIYDM